jgi:hypothetical protein
MREERAGAEWAARSHPPSQLVRRTKSEGMVVHDVEHASRRGATRQTETLLGFKQRQFGQERNGKSSVETEGALCGIIKF